MQQISAGYNSDSEEDEQEKLEVPERLFSSSNTSSSSSSSRTAQSSSSSTFFAPRAPVIQPSQSSQSNANVIQKVAEGRRPAHRPGVKKVFKHIEINISDGDSEEEYLPPKKYEEDSTSDDSNISEGESDDEAGKLKEIAEDLPKSSGLSRKRKIKVSKGVYERKKVTKKKGKKAKTAYDRIKDFPDDMLTVLNGILTCRACNSEVSLKSSVIKLHINGETHKRNVVNRDKSQLTLLDYRKMVVVNERMENAAGATIALDVSAYRMSVCHALLKSATPFSILDSGSEIRNLLEDGHAKCPKQACSDMIPLLQKKEYDETVSELSRVSSFSLSSDGTINVAEALAVVRFCHVL